MSNTLYYPTNETSNSLKKIISNKSYNCILQIILFVLCMTGFTNATIADQQIKNKNELFDFRIPTVSGNQLAARGFDRHVDLYWAEPTDQIKPGKRRSNLFNVLRSRSAKGPFVKVNELFFVPSWLSG